MIGGGFFLAAITFKQKGGFNNLTIWFNKLLSAFKKGIFDKYGKMGVEALKEATPVETGKTANSWYYKISNTSTGISIQFCNSNINKSVPIAIILQYGHGTGTGGYVEGIDYINPAIRPIFNKMSSDLRKEVTAL